MKHLYRFLIIIAISLIGELMSTWIPLPVPGSIYGMVLMFAGLCTKVIPLEKVREEGHFLIDIMPVMFVPAAVGLIDTWGNLRAMLVPVLLCVAVVTFVVMLASGYATQAVIRLTEKKRGRAE